MHVRKKNRRSIVLKNNSRRDIRLERKKQQEALICSNWGVKEATQVDGGGGGGEEETREGGEC